MKKYLSEKTGWLILASLALGMILVWCIHPNDSPVISNLACQKSWIDTATDCEIECLASDIDGDALTYTWSAAAGILSGSGPVITWIAPDQAGIYSIVVDVFDEHGTATTSQTEIEVRVNHEPGIETILAKPSDLRAGDESVLTCVASDPDGDKLDYTWSANGGEVSRSGLSATWTAPEETGMYLVRVEVADDRGGVAREEKEVEVKDNLPPVIPKLNARTLQVNPGVPVKIECTASDPEEDSLSYAWTASGGSIIGEGPIINWRAPEEYGVYAVSVTVSDDRSGQTHRELSIEVKKCG